MVPTISVCLPVYNGSAYLREAIESVLNQTFEDFELIVCDDYSSDGSREIIADFAQRDSRIVFVPQNNRVGLFANYNRCLRKASGKYIKPFAQDDLLDRGALKAMRRILEEHPRVVLASCASRVIDASGMIDTDNTGPEHPFTIASGRPVSGGAVIQHSLLPIVNFIGEPVRIMFRRITAGNGFDESYQHLGDLEYWLRILRHGHYYFLNQELCAFRKHAESCTVHNLRSLNFAADMIRMASDFRPELEKAGYSHERYIDRLVTDIGKCVNDLNQKGELLESDLDHYITADSGSQASDIAFRKLAFYSLSRIGNHNEIEAPEYNLSRLVRHRERSLRALLRSRSWRWTRIFREIRKGQNQVKLEDQFLASIEREYQTDSGDLLYLHYLRKTIISIRASASWLISSPLRLFEH